MCQRLVLVSIAIYGEIVSAGHIEVYSREFHCVRNGQWTNSVVNTVDSCESLFVRDTLALVDAGL